MEEKKPGLLVKKKTEWIGLVQKAEFVQGSLRDSRVRVEEAEEMGSDGEGGKAEVQAEMGVTPPPSQSPV